MTQIVQAHEPLVGNCGINPVDPTSTISFHHHRFPTPHLTSSAVFRAWVDCQLSSCGVPRQRWPKFPKAWKTSRFFISSRGLHGQGWPILSIKSINVTSSHHIDTDTRILRGTPYSASRTNDTYQSQILRSG